MSLEEDYQAAKTAILRNRKVPVSHQMRLQLFGLFQQAERGDCDSNPPSQSNIIAYQKWMEYSRHKGMEVDEAKAKYTELVGNILNTKIKRAPSAPPALPPTLPPLDVELASNRSLKISKRSDTGSQSESLKKEKPIVEIIPRVEAPAVDPMPKVTSPTPKEKAPSKGKKSRNGRQSSKHSTEKAPPLPPLPMLRKPTGAHEDMMVRKNLFKSRAFSSIDGVINPLLDGEDNVERKYELYEKVRAFYEKHDPERVKRGLGNIVEWTMTHGEDALNDNLSRKYGTNLAEMEKQQSEELQKQRVKTKKETRKQLVLSKRLLTTNDVTTRKKLDKLTRFLLVNDPELVSRGMFVMVKFIEAKGLGALNENLKQNYGKTLDSVSDEELNEELVNRYGTDLGMLERPFFASDETGEEEDPDKSVRSSEQIPLADQMMALNPLELQKNMRNASSKSKETDYLRSTVGGETQSQRPNPKRESTDSPSSMDNRNSIEQKEVIPTDIRSSTDKNRVSTEKMVSPDNRNQERTNGLSSRRFPKGVKDSNQEENDQSFDDAHFRVTISPDRAYEMEFEQHKDDLKQFIEIYEPYRYKEAYKLISDYFKRNGLTKLNARLREKYDVDLSTFRDVPDENNNMSEEEFELRVHQFATKHEKANNIDRAVAAIKEYRRRQGLAALNTKLLKRYGETLNNVILDETAPGGQGDVDMSMEALHRPVLPSDLKEKLSSYYAKYDPMIIQDDGDGIERIFEWTERNGMDALDQQLKAKYKESLTEFREAEEALRRELQYFYSIVDPKKSNKAQIEKVLAWALLNGMDALNFNLRRKYNADIKSVRKTSRATASNAGSLDI